MCGFPRIGTALLLVSIARDRGDIATALRHARELAVLAPNDVQLGLLVRDLESRKARLGRRTVSAPRGRIGLTLSFLLLSMDGAIGQPMRMVESFPGAQAVVDGRNAEYSVRFDGSWITVRPGCPSRRTATWSKP